MIIMVGILCLTMVYADVYKTWGIVVTKTSMGVDNSITKCKLWMIIIKVCHNMHH